MQGDLDVDEKIVVKCSDRLNAIFFYRPVLELKKQEDEVGKEDKEEERLRL